MKNYLVKIGIVVLISSFTLFLNGCSLGSHIMNLPNSFEESMRVLKEAKKDAALYESSAKNNSTHANSACGKKTIYVTKIYQAQIFLTNDGLYKGPIDCDYGPGTKSAVTKWLQRNGYSGYENIDFFLEKRSSQEYGSL